MISNLRKYMIRLQCIIVVLLLLIGVKANAAGLEIEFVGDSQHKVVIDTPPAQSGLPTIFVVFDISKIKQINISGIEDVKSVKLKEYSNLGATYAKELSVSQNINSISLTSPLGDCGYIVEHDGVEEHFWVVDYAKHRFVAESVTGATEQSCDRTKLNFDGDAGPIYYYTLTGQRKVLSRGINISYYNLQWDANAQSWNANECVTQKDYIETDFDITPALLCSSSVMVLGDCFLRAWDSEVSVESASLTPNGLDVRTTVKQHNAYEDMSNVMNGSAQAMLGGSAPVTIDFNAYPTDAVIHNEWQVSSDPEFSTIDSRYTERDLNLTFDKEGRFYLRYVGSNATGTCETIGESYEVAIGNSDLRIPNAFSPNGDGVNDVWKVSYRSLTQFKCVIFNRSGQQVFSFSNPSMGWDGTENGKKVISGVYYYVIEAVGADGVRYKRSGDINIVGFRKPQTSSQ